MPSTKVDLLDLSHHVVLTPLTRLCVGDDHCGPITGTLLVLRLRSPHQRLMVHGCAVYPPRYPDPGLEESNVRLTVFALTGR